MDKRQVTESFTDQDSQQGEYAQKKKKSALDDKQESEDFSRNQPTQQSHQDSGDKINDGTKKDGKDILIFDNYRFASDLESSAEPDSEYEEDEFIDDEEFKPGLFSRLFASRKRNRQDAEFDDDERCIRDRGKGARQSILKGRCTYSSRQGRP